MKPTIGRGSPPMGSISQLGANRFISIHTSVHSIDNIQSAGGSTVVVGLREIRDLEGTHRFCHFLLSKLMCNGHLLMEI